MNKKIMGALVAVIAMFGLSANAQNVMDKSSSIFTVGVGITDHRIPLSVAFDHGIVGNVFDSPDATLSLGGMLGTSFGRGYNGLFIGPRVGLHYHFIPQLDTYMSLMLGLEAGKYKDHNVSTDWHTDMGWGTHVGARYMFTPTVGGFIELGYGYSFANIGLAFKL